LPEIAVTASEAAPFDGDGDGVGDAAWKPSAMPSTIPARTHQNAIRSTLDIEHNTATTDPFPVLVRIPESMIQDARGRPVVSCFASAPHLETPVDKSGQLDKYVPNTGTNPNHGVESDHVDSMSH
jgi:hypothetical protein